MDQFDKFEEKLNQISSRIEADGTSPELEAELEKLFEKASVLVILGPNEAFERSEEDKARQWADKFDLDYYKDTFENVDYPAFFKSVAWGEAKVSYEEHVVEGKPTPFCRIAWHNKIAFVTEADTDNGKKTIEAYLNYFAMVLACRWFRWKVEVV